MSLIKDTLDKVQEAARRGDPEASSPPPPGSTRPAEPTRGANPDREVEHQPPAPRQQPPREASPPERRDPAPRGSKGGARWVWSLVLFLVCLLLGAQVVYLADTFFSLSSLLP